jgi:hypothetical protein
VLGCSSINNVSFISICRSNGDADDSKPAPARPEESAVAIKKDAFVKNGKFLE